MVREWFLNSTCWACVSVDCRCCKVYFNNDNESDHKSNLLVRRFQPIGLVSACLFVCWFVLLFFSCVINIYNKFGSMLTDTPEPHSLSFSLFFFGCHLFFTIRLICLKPKIAWLNLYFLVWMCVLQIYYKHFGEMSISHNTFSAYHFHSNQIARFTIIVQLCLSFLSKKESHFILFEPKIRKKVAMYVRVGKKRWGNMLKNEQQRRKTNTSHETTHFDTHAFHTQLVIWTKWIKVWFG